MELSKHTQDIPFFPVETLEFSIVFFKQCLLYRPDDIFNTLAANSGCCSFFIFLSHRIKYLLVSIDLKISALPSCAKGRANRRLTKFPTALARWIHLRGGQHASFLYFAIAYHRVARFFPECCVETLYLGRGWYTPLVCISSWADQNGATHQFMDALAYTSACHRKGDNVLRNNSLLLPRFLQFCLLQ